MKARLLPASPFSDGVFYDWKDKLFRMWYLGGYIAATCMATSRDGTNIVLDHRETDRASDQRFRDSSTVWLDHRAKPKRRFKMFTTTHLPRRWSLALRCSPDGIHWSQPLATSATTIGDRTTVHYNPFRKKWVFGFRTSFEKVGRARRYAEDSDSAAGTARMPRESVPWLSADRLDPKHPDPERSNEAPQLYNHDAVAYESLMVGLFAIWQGPRNSVCRKLHIQKRNELLVGFSRDGFHYHRPDRRRFIGVNEAEGAWNWGNVQSVGGGFCVVGEKLYFYYSGRSISDRFWDGNIRTGLAVLRRDGFASLDAGATPGTVTTRPILFHGKRLFVNIDAPRGELRAAVMDTNGQPLDRFSLSACKPVSGDHTLVEVTWPGQRDLSELAGRPVRMRFQLTNGRLYAFWISPDESGASYGYVAAGGPGFMGAIDTVGNKSLQQ